MSSNVTAKKILIVEDDQSIREVLRLGLESDGYKVDVATNGAEALAIIVETRDFNLVLLDMTMPELNGEQFLKEIASHRKYSKIPIIITSAEEESEAMIGAASYLKKPIDLEELLKLIAKHTTIRPKP